MHKAIKTAIAAAALAGAFLGGQHYAHAAPAVKALPVTTTVDFSGPEVGFDLDALHMDNTAVNTQTKFDFSGRGRIGYNYQTSSGWVIGVEGADGTSSGIERNYGTKDSIGNQLFLDGRAGKIVDSNLLYAKLGYGFENVTESNLVDGVKNSADFSGLRMGGGIERFLAPNVTGRAEVVYTDYQTKTLDSNSVDPSNVAATLGVSYKFR